jgi:hypothetical protein
MSLPAFQPEMIRQSLLAIAETNNGLLAPAAVVEAARDPTSVLHDHFTWDDGEAAAKCRLAEAGMLIRRVKLNLIRHNQPPRQVALSVVAPTESIEPVRQFHSLPDQRADAGGYEALEHVMSDEAKRDALVQQVLRDLQAYRKRYSTLAELADVWAAIDAALGSPSRHGAEGPAE